MPLQQEQQVTYLGNVIFLAFSDGSASSLELAALEEVRAEIGARKSTMETALKIARDGTFAPVLVGGLADQVNNLSDMLYVAIVDGDLSETEKKIISGMSRDIRLSQDQTLALTRDAIERWQTANIKIACPSCGMQAAAGASYCTKCGAPLNADSAASDFQIPTAGVAIEFCESTSAQFPTALKIAQAAPTYATVIRGKKSWYLAAWPESGFAEATNLAQPLGTLRNRRCYHGGVEVPWDELFGFTWCASQRQSAYRPAAYCFGKDDNRINCWGCKQARMDWTEWAQWFSYGQFEKGGFLSRNCATWTFDKERIRHELDTNLHRFRYCPHMHKELIDAALDALPDQIVVTDGGAWKFSRAYEQTPGSIIVKEKEQSFDGRVFETEYFADGVRPRSLEALAEVLRKAFAAAQVTDVEVSAILR